MVTEPANAILIKQARTYFNKALNLDSNDEVAQQYIGLVSASDMVLADRQIDRPDNQSALDSDIERSRRTTSQSFSGRSGNATSQAASDPKYPSSKSEDEGKDGEERDDAESSDGENTDVPDDSLGSETSLEHLLGRHDNESDWE